MAEVDDREVNMILGNMAVPDELLKEIKSVVQQRLAPAKVLDVQAEDGVDWDGDPMLTVHIFVPSSAVEVNRPDAKKFISLIRHVFPILLKAGDPRWPFFNIRYIEEESNVPV